MAKRYETFARDSKANASAAYSIGKSVRVEKLATNPVTHKTITVSVVTFQPGQFETLHQAVQKTFGTTHAHHELLIYRVGLN
jgi:hypothetical protein